MDAGKRLTLKMLFAAMLAMAGGGLAMSAALAAEDPIPGVDVIVEKVPPGNSVGSVITDRNGVIAFRHLAPGNYVVSDKAGNSASIRHEGGLARWQLVRNPGRGDARGWALLRVSAPSPARTAQ